MAAESDDPIREARARAVNALKPLTWEQARAAAATWLGGTLAFSGVAAGFVAADMFDRTIAWRLCAVTTLACALGAFGFLYIARLTEQAAALRDLLSLTKQYEILLRTAWDERDQAKESAQRRENENTVLRTLITVRAFSTMEIPDDPGRRA